MAIDETARGAPRPAGEVRVSVCIPTVRAATLEHAIRSVRAQDFSGWELLVVGQGADSSLRTATERAADGDLRVRYLHLRTTGLSAARNAALREAAGEIVAFMDDDCEAEVDWLAQLDRCFEEDVDLVSGAVLAPARERRRFAVCPSVVPGEVTFALRPGDAALPAEFDALGANLAVRRRTAVRVGGFDEHLGAGARFPGGEEHDLVHRLAVAGATLRSTPGAVVRHTYGVRSGMRAVYQHRRQRLRGDGAGAAKRAMLGVPEGGLSVGRSVRRAASEQLETVRLGRLPFAVLRLFDYLTSYRECLRHFALSEAARRDPALAVLMPRRDEGRRRVTAPPALAPRR